MFADHWVSRSQVKKPRPLLRRRLPGSPCYSALVTLRWHPSIPYSVFTHNLHQIILMPDPYLQYPRLRTV